MIIASDILFSIKQDFPLIFYQAASYRLYDSMCPISRAYACNEQLKTDNLPRVCFCQCLLFLMVGFSHLTRLFFSATIFQKMKLKIL